jgi:hypothetical protein
MGFNSAFKGLRFVDLYQKGWKTTAYFTTETDVNHNNPVNKTGYAVEPKSFKDRHLEI